MKYIVFDEELPILFPEEIHHIVIAKLFHNYEATSAGHFDLYGAEDGGVITTTRDQAETIRLMPDGGDADLIDSFLNDDND